MAKKGGMDPAAWRLFIDAVELGSLSKVAAAHGTRQPHVSRQIGELERECGGRLFQRTGRGVVLTALGQRVAPKVRSWLASTEQLANDIKATSGKPVGRVRLGILPSTAHPLVSTLYYSLQERHPLVQLNVREGQGALEEGSLDLAILYRHSPTPKNGDVYLIEAPTYLVSAAGDKATSRPTVPFSVLGKLPLVLFCRPSTWRDRLDELAAERGISLNVAAEADSLSLQARIVADGGMYALLGAYAIRTVAKECRLASSKLVNPVVSRHMAIAMSRHSELTLACRAVMSEIQRIVKAGATRRSQG
jgi:LysR family nitrogen assimilation transcriptional regulator